MCRFGLFRSLSVLRLVEKCSGETNQTHKNKWVSEPRMLSIVRGLFAEVEPINFFENEIFGNTSFLQKKIKIQFLKFL